MNWFVLSLFLYFPEDKSEYLPAALWLIAFTILAMLTMKFVIRHSKKEAEKAREYEKALQRRMAESENK